MSDSKKRKSIKMVRRYLVEESDTAEAVGSGSVNVLATPQLIAWMEQVAHLLIVRNLEEGMLDVGVEVFLRHLRPVKIGEEVKVEVKIVMIKGPRVTFEIGADVGEIAVARGTHVRQILKSRDFG